jgi:shikimate dehydrogenase
MPGPFVPEKIYGIIGHPLAQTLSPLLHNWGFSRLGVKAAYLAFPTPPERLEAFVQAVRTLPVSGLSVTIPHKEAVMPFLDRVSDLARRAGAVNTLVWEDGRLVGHNTDVTGFVAPLLERGFTKGVVPREQGTGSQLHMCVPAPESALVLGAGGAAKAVLAGLQDLGIAYITVSNRHLARAQALAGQFGVRAVAWEESHRVQARLVVNTTPMGMKGKAEGESPLPEGFWTPEHLAYDLVYNPRQTLFLRQARAAGAEVVDGLAMFAAQGAAQFRLWTGLALPMEEVEELLARALGLEERRRREPG